MAYVIIHVFVWSWICPHAYTQPCGGHIANPYTNCVAIFTCVVLLITHAHIYMNVLVNASPIVTRFLVKVLAVITRPAGCWSGISAKSDIAVML